MSWFYLQSPSHVPFSVGLCNIWPNSQLLELLMYHLKRKTKGRQRNNGGFFVLKAVLHAVAANSEAQSLSNENRFTHCCTLNFSSPQRKQWRFWALSPRQCFVAVLGAQSC